jgi:hypothetical protein
MLWNLHYAYAAGNPITFRDPYGLFWMPGDPLPQVVVDVGEGLGEGAVNALTFNRVNLQETLALLGRPNGGANTCSVAYQAAHAVGATAAAVGAVGAGVTKAVQVAGTVASAARATLLSAQLLTGSSDIIGSFEEGGSLIEQLTNLEEMHRKSLEPRVCRSHHVGLGILGYRRPNECTQPQIT